MEKAGYPDLAEHKILHHRMVQKTEELHEQYLQNETDIAMKTMSFLKDWWTGHIMDMDLRYKPYVEKAKAATER